MFSQEYVKDTTILTLRKGTRHVSLLPVLEQLTEFSAHEPAAQLYFSGLVEDDSGQVWRLHSPVPAELDLDDLSAFYLNLEDLPLPCSQVRVRLAAARQSRQARSLNVLSPMAAWLQNERAVFWIGAPPSMHDDIHQDSLADFALLEKALASLEQSSEGNSTNGERLPQSTGSLIERLVAVVRVAPDDARLYGQASELAECLGLRHAFACAMQRPTGSIEQTLRAAGFSQMHNMNGCPSLHQLFPAGTRCGIYVLHINDGTCYVGQTSDITRRYTQHSKQSAAIEWLSFKPVQPAQLDRCERETIATLEAAGFPLLNIEHTSIAGTAGVEALMTPHEQQHWLEDVLWVDESGTRPDTTILRAKYEVRYRHFKQTPHAGEVITVLRAYTRAAVPAYRRSEGLFWACACLPAVPAHTAFQCDARIIIGGVETCCPSVSGDTPAYAFYAALSPLTVGRALLELFAAYPGLELTADATYIQGDPQPLQAQVYDMLLDNPRARITQTCARELAEHLPALFGRHPTLTICQDRVQGGPDQARFSVRQKDASLALLHDCEIRRALRTYTMALLKKGFGHYSHAHCPALADALIDHKPQNSC